jgi:6-phosphogluconolactonase
MDSVHPELRLVASVAEAGAELFADTAKASVAKRGRFVAVLSGGTTPLDMFERLREYGDLPWHETYLFWGDERFVPLDHTDSNFGAARQALLQHIPLPETHAFPWPHVEGYPERCALIYAEIITDLLGPEPTFDLTFLGLGEDGHTASLFPGTEALRDTGLTVATTNPHTGNPRLTMTIGALSRSRVVAFLVSGESKRAALEATLAAPYDPERHPAQAIRALERLIWLTDLKGVPALKLQG